MAQKNKVFVDTNVLLDFLAARKPFDTSAKRLFQLAESGTIELCASALSFCNIAYILRKLMPGSDVQQMLQELSLIVTITPVDTFVIQQALQSHFADFEDAVQYMSALQTDNITHLVTRNASDFNESRIPVVSPDEYLSNHF